MWRVKGREFEGRKEERPLLAGFAADWALQLIRKRVTTDGTRCWKSLLLDVRLAVNAERGKAGRWRVPVRWNGSGKGQNAPYDYGRL